MTGPRISSGASLYGEAQAGSSGASLYQQDKPRITGGASLYYEAPEEEPGFFGKLDNRITNLGKLAMVGLGVGTEKMELEVGQALVAAEGTGGASLSRAWEDIGKLGKSIVGMNSDQFKTAVGELRNISVSDIVSGIPEMIQTFVTAPIESVIGVGLDKETLYGMTPEERATRIKETAGNIVMVALSGGTGKLIEKGFERPVAAALAKAATVPELNAVARQAAAGAFKRTVIKGAAEGVIGGTAQGAIASAGDPDAFARAFVQGVAFAPLGVAFETLRGRMLGRTTDEFGRKVEKQAAALSQTRQLNVTTQESLSGSLKMITGIESANPEDLASAVVAGKLAATPNQPIVVSGVDNVGNVLKTAHAPTTGPAPGMVRLYSSGTNMLVSDVAHAETAGVHFGTKPQYVDVPESHPALETSLSGTKVMKNAPADVMGELKDINRNKTNTYVFPRQDGLHDVLVTAEPLSPTAARSFRQSGFVPSQLLEYKGKEWEFSSVSRNGKNVNLKDPATGKTINVPREHVRVQAEVTSTAGMHGAENVKYKTKGGFDVSPENVHKAVYNDFAGFVAEQEAKQSKGMPTPVDPLETIPTKSFDKYMEEYASARGYKPEEMAALEHVLANELYHSVKNEILDVDELSAIERLQKEAYENLTPETQAFAKVKQSAFDLVTDAESNGMFVDDLEHNAIRLRDSATNKEIGTFKSVREARQFISQSGAAKGTDLITNTPGVHRKFGSAVMPVPDGPLKPNQVPFPVRPNNWYQDILDKFATSWDWATPNRSIMTSLDSKYGTELFSRVFDKLQVARLKTNALIQPWYTKLKRIEDIDKHMSMEDRRTVGGWLTAQSPETIKKSMSAAETAIADTFLKANIDMDLVMRYTREMGQKAKEFKAGTPELAAAETIAQKEMGVDAMHAKAAEVVQGMRGSKDVALGRVTRYMDAVRIGAEDRAGYEVSQKMTAKQIRMAREMESLQNSLADTFKLPKEYRLEFFMGHSRVYDEGNLIRTIERDFKVPKDVAQLYAKLIKTGEVDVQEMDPIRRMQRFIKAGYDSQNMLPFVDEARAAIKEEVLKLPPEAREKTSMMANRYVNDVMGYPGAAQKFTQAGVDDLLNKWNVKSKLDVRRSIVDKISATAEAAFQGFRVHAGIRDFAQGTGFFYMRFGAKRTANMLEYGTKGLDGVTAADLQRVGEIGGLSALYFSTPTEFAGGKLGGASSLLDKATRGVAEAGMKASMQKNVYALLHAGAYLESWKMAGEKVTAYARGEITKKQAYKALKIDTYEPSVIKQFDDLVEAGKTEEAARFLGRQTAAETIGVFGMGNNPGGWQRNIGRIAGQLGGWSMWFRSMVNQNLSRGTVGNRLGFIARAGVVQAGIAATGAALGVNFASWYMHRGLLFGGGPAVDIMQDVNTAIAGYGYEQDAAQRRLAKLVPIDPITGKFNIGQPYIPGSYFANDLAEAAQMVQEGANPLQALGQAAGFRVEW